MVSVLDSGSSIPGSTPGQGYCVLFLGKTLYSPHSVSLHPGVNRYWLMNMSGQPDKSAEGY